MTDNTHSRGLDFTTSDFLFALRSSQAYTADKIHEAVVSLARERNPGFATDASSTNSAEYYQQVLRSMGYRLQPAGLDPEYEYPEKTLLTFQTRFVSFDGEDGSLSNPTSGTPHSQHVEIVKEVLREAGFDRAFFAVLFADNPEKAITQAFPRANPSSYIKWYYLTRHAIEQPDLPPCCMFFHSKSRFPCLLIGELQTSDPTQFRKDLEIRVIHEVLHYYLMFTLFLDDESPRSEMILDLAGWPISDFLLQLISETYAHIETLRLFGEDFMRHAPHNSAMSTPSTSLLSASEDGLSRWLRETRLEYFSTLQFSMVFPWICAVALFDEDRIGTYCDMLKKPFKRLAQHLIPPMLSIYSHGSLNAPDILSMVKQIEGSTDVLARLNASSAMDAVREEDAFARFEDALTLATTHSADS